MDCSWTGSSVHGNSSMNGGIGCHALLQEISLIQELNQGLLHCRQILYQLRHKGSPIILEWVACSLSSRFLTQELNQGLLHCRQILYQLSYQGSPDTNKKLVMLFANIFSFW